MVEDRSDPAPRSGRTDAERAAPGVPPAAATDRRVVLPLDILPQPDDVTCGPTCLHAVYRYWGADLVLDEVVRSCGTLASHGAGRGTLAVMLGIDAIRRGFRAELLTYDLRFFDPTWFDEHGRASAAHLADRLARQAEARPSGRGRRLAATRAYLEFLDLGGTIAFRDLDGATLAGFIRQGLPVLTGLSATYLYRSMREFGPHDDEDDIRGEPAGHFVVLHGWDPAHRRVAVADPLADNPGFGDQRYEVRMSRLVAAIMLGVLTHDANLLLVRPAVDPEPGRC